MDEKEIWLPVVGYEGLYEVSNLGNVKSLKFGKTRVLKPVFTSVGYLQVGLWKNRKRQMKQVHRLVAEAFIPNQKALPQVNHKDECKTNNAVSNLEWCTCKYNINHGTRNARVAAAKSKPVQQLSFDGSLITTWPSTHEAWRQTGVKQGNICSCCNGKLHSTGGYKWQYAN